MANYQQIMYDIEVHSVEGIRKYFEEGGNPNEVHGGVPLFTTMVEMYLRSPRFKMCVQAFIDNSLDFDDKPLLAVLSDNSLMLEKEISRDASVVNKTYSRYNNTFTPLAGGTLLHYCAEYNHLECAKVLVKYGADVNAKAGLDEYGFGGHTPVFHTVCQHDNNSIEMLNFLLSFPIDLKLTVKGLIWGKGYEWETFIPAINPISYTMMGLLPQMHREQRMIAENIRLLIKHAFEVDFELPNIPNAYLAH